MDILTEKTIITDHMGVLAVTFCFVVVTECVCYVIIMSIILFKSINFDLLLIFL